MHLEKLSGFYETAERKLHDLYLGARENDQWIEYPKIVSIETYAKCNARCSFCPYPTLDRIGDRLEPNDIFKLVDEMADYPVPPEHLNFSRVNEPFLDPNIFTYLQYADEKLPKTKLLIFSNGQTLIDKTLDGLAALTNFTHLSVSFNDHDPDVYQETMGIDHAKTVRNLDNLHARHTRGELPFAVSLTRAGSSDDRDREFIQWCNERYPGFLVKISANFTWIASNSANARDINIAPKAGCVQWFSVHVLADRSAAFCSVDGHGAMMDMTIDTHSLYEMYNEPNKRRIRENILTRKNIKKCDACILGMPASAYASAERKIAAA